MTIQDQAGEARIDYNALDNTASGQLIQAGFIFAFCAAPDFTRHPGWVRAAITAANLITIGVFNAFDEDPRNDLTAAVEAEQGELESVALSWGVVGGLSAGAVAAGGALTGVVRVVASTLRRKGADKPYTLAGLMAAIAYVAAERLRT